MIKMSPRSHKGFVAAQTSMFFALKIETDSLLAGTWLLNRRVLCDKRR